MRVLVVDADRLMRWAIVETLVLGGHLVVEATNAFDGVRMLVTTPFDVVLIDCTHGCQAFELLPEIRQNAPATRIVLLTAFPTPEFLDAAHRQGVHSVLNKPFDMASLAAAVLHAAA